MIPEGARVAHRASHEWLVPRRAVVGILAFSCAFLLVGVVLLAIGAGRNVGITALGAILTGLGGTGITLCVLLCLYAYCVWYVKDEGTQTGDTPVTVSTDFEIPTYATVQKPSSLKNQDASLRRNGKPPIAKRVTLPPELPVEREQPPLYTPVSEHTPQIHTYSPRTHYATPQRVTPQTPPSHYQVPPSRYPGSPGEGPYASLAESRVSAPHSVHSPGGTMASQHSPGGTIYPLQEGPGRATIVTYHGGATPQTFTSLPPLPPHSQYQPPRQQQPQFGHGILTRYPLDDDYDNPAEHSPMLISSPQQQRSAYQAHQQKSGFQQKTSFQTQQQQKSFQSQQQQQQQQQKTSMWRGGAADDVPEPQPLQYPSARRPMTFEQTSSSKMSIYDNVLFPHQE